MLPSGPQPPIWFLVFPLVLWCKSFRLKLFLVFFLFPFLLCDLPILIFWFKCPSRCLAQCINCWVHCSIWDASIPLLVLGHRKSLLTHIRGPVLFLHGTGQNINVNTIINIVHVISNSVPVILEVSYWPIRFPESQCWVTNRRSSCHIREMLLLTHCRSNSFSLVNYRVLSRI